MIILKFNSSEPCSH